MRVEQRLDGDHHTRGAETALNGAVTHERVLDGVERRVGADALDRHHAHTIGADSERQASTRQPAVDQHGARTAGSLAAALLGSKQSQAVAQQLDQRPVPGYVYLDSTIVDGELQDGHYATLPSTRPVTTRRTHVRSMSRR